MVNCLPYLMLKLLQDMLQDQQGSLLRAEGPLACELSPTAAWWQVTGKTRCCYMVIAVLHAPAVVQCCCMSASPLLLLMLRSFGVMGAAEVMGYSCVCDVLMLQDSVCLKNDVTAGLRHASNSCSCCMQGFATDTKPIRKDGWDEWLRVHFQAGSGLLA